MSGALAWQSKGNIDFHTQFEIDQHTVQGTLREGTIPRFSFVGCGMLPAGAPRWKIISAYVGCQGLVVELLLDVSIILLHEEYDAKYLYVNL
ncbi:hypothetical protein Pint_08945 [Pistacia integerrima]|uniref:Uncharacterized protein n=1 Tax=Pistacia integerrima TaxID=434235 RepID=A0ACC0XUX5_9ROSI|nr:hypothetical protein Pint_08945 [Pistacia integerrima]